MHKTACSRISSRSIWEVKGTVDPACLAWITVSSPVHDSFDTATQEQQGHQTSFSFLPCPWHSSLAHEGVMLASDIICSSIFREGCFDSEGLLLSLRNLFFCARRFVHMRPSWAMWQDPVSNYVNKQKKIFSRNLSRTPSYLNGQCCFK